MGINPLKSIINRDALEVFLGYLDLASPQEIRYDLVFSTLFTSFVILFSSVNSDIKTVIDFFNSNIGSVISALSILAGFNITSIAVIATSRSDLCTSLKKQTVPGKNASLLQQIIAFFSWTIMVQLFSLLMSVIAIFIFNFFLPINNEPLFAIKGLRFSYINLTWVLLFSGTWLVSYSITLTVRNISILYHYLVYISKID